MQFFQKEKIKQTVKQKTASYILMSFFGACFLSAFERTTRVCAQMLSRCSKF